MEKPPRRFFRKKVLVKAVGVVALILILVLAIASLYVHTHRDEIGSALQDKLEETFHGKVRIGKVRLSVFGDFPHLSLTLLNTEIKDTLYYEHLLNIEKIHLRVSVFELLFRQVNVRAVTLENGSVFLFKDRNGYANTDVFQTFSRGEKSGGRFDFLVKRFFCNNISFVFEEQRLGKRISVKLEHIKGKVDQDEEEMFLSLNGTAHVDSLMFLRGKGSYLRDKALKIDARMILNYATRELNFQETNVVFDEQQFALSGCFILRKPVFLNLYIDNPACDFNITKTALTPKIQESLASFNVKQPVNVRIGITGESQPMFPPMVDVFVELRNQDMQAYKVDFSNMVMQGVFTNHLKASIRNDKHNSGIFLNVERGKMEYIPFAARFSIADMEKLYCRAEWKTKMDLTDFNMHEVFDEFYFNKGTAALQFSYSGNLGSYKDSISIDFNDTLTGFLSVQDGMLEYPKRQLSIHEIDASVFFNEEEFTVECLHAVLNENILELSGKMAGVRRLLTEEVEKMTGTFELYSPHFNISKVLLGKNEKTAPFMEKKRSGLTFVPTIVKKVTNDVKFDVAIKASTLQFRNLTAQKITGNLVLSSRGLALRDLRMSTCGGDAKFSALLRTQGKGDRMEAKAEVRNVNVKHFFRTTDNFDQTAITHENLSGVLDAQVEFNGLLDNEYKPISDSIRARIFFSLKNGELTNYGPVAEIDNFIFRKRDMHNIQFAEIKDTFLLNGKELTIMKMELASSVVRLFVKGKYTFDGPAEIYVQVPLRNLRKPDADAAMKNFRLDERPGASIFLKVHGTAGNLKVSLSPAGRRELKGEEKTKEDSLQSQ